MSACVRFFHCATRAVARTTANASRTNSTSLMPMKAKTARRQGSWKSVAAASAFLPQMPPRREAMITRLPPARPSGPFAA
ncbi:hypothetical protein RHOFW510R12_36730 [Rhodanobacter sp. FW510-R12]